MLCYYYYYLKITLICDLKINYAFLFYIIIIVLLSDSHKLCCDEDTATKTEKICLRIPNQSSMYAF